jgi:hypothetical protein
MLHTSAGASAQAEPGPVAPGPGSEGRALASEPVADGEVSPAGNAVGPVDPGSGR